jgi:hypothetical protein
MQDDALRPYNNRARNKKKVLTYVVGTSRR